MEIRKRRGIIEMKLTIKKFGTGMHVVIPVSSGFKIGDEIFIKSPVEKEYLTKKEAIELIKLHSR